MKKTLLVSGQLMEQGKKPRNDMVTKGNKFIQPLAGDIGTLVYSGHVKQTDAKTGSKGKKSHPG